MFIILQGPCSVGCMLKHCLLSCWNVQPVHVNLGGDGFIWTLTHCIIQHEVSDVFRFCKQSSSVNVSPASPRMHRSQLFEFSTAGPYTPRPCLVLKSENFSEL